jgi:hypothetical protein
MRKIDFIIQHPFLGWIEIAKLKPGIFFSLSSYQVKGTYGVIIGRDIQFVQIKVRGDIEVTPFD